MTCVDSKRLSDLTAEVGLGRAFWLFPAAGAGKMGTLPNILSFLTCTGSAVASYSPASQPILKCEEPLFESCRENRRASPISDLFDTRALLQLRRRRNPRRQRSHLKAPLLACSQSGRHAVTRESCVSPSEHASGAETAHMFEAMYPHP